MADTQNGPYVQPPERRPEPAFSKDELIFTAEEKALIQEFVRQYPSAEGAVMKTLWLAQEKFGWLPPEVIQLVSDELDMPYSQTYGVATFYTQYYKKEMGKHVIDVCTCFSCQVCGGYDMLHYIEDKLGIKDGETTPEVIQLVSDELDMPYSQTYGVATFYTQYYKKEMGKHVIDVCTCFSCQVCGGYDMLHYIEDKLGIKDGETTPDGMFTVKGVECLGSCGTAPMLQVTNGSYVHNLTREKIDALIDSLRDDSIPPFVSVTLPQDEDEMQGNRRSDALAVEGSVTPPVSETLR